MKTKIALLAILAAFTGCSTLQFNDALITSAVSVGTVTGLRLSLTDPAKRTTIANYIDVVAQALRTITGNPTVEQLTIQVQAFIPAQIQRDFPQVIAFTVPLIVNYYQAAYAKSGGNAKKLYQVLSDIAIGLEDGAAIYVTPPNEGP